MSGRFSFDNDDEHSFAPRHTNSIPQQQYQSARGRDYDAPYEDDDRLGGQHYTDASPTRAAHSLSQAQRDPHNISAAAPIPPPHQNMSHPGYGAPGGAVAGYGAGAGMDTAYHGSAGYDDYQAYNPFEHAEQSHMQAPAHNYPEYPQNELDDPFASHRTSYNNLAPPNSYEMQQRPGMSSNRPNSFGSPYGNYDHAASEGDLGSFDPRDIADEDDDTGALASKQRSRGPAAAVGAAGVGGLAAGIASRDASGKYNAVPGGGGGGGGGGEKGATNIVGKASKNKRTMWTIFAVIGIIIVLAIIGGVVGAYVYSHKGGSSSGTTGGDYDKNSKEIKELMNNKNLHKVFPGVDYTPFGAQYPDCLSYPPSQNNVTMDLAVMSQLTPVVRLYGTDCNQTEMLLTAIERLDMKDDIKVWMGVYLNDNQTTNDRQLQQMWDILEKSGPDQFEGVIVGNEVLFNHYMTEDALGKTLDEVHQNLSTKGYKLPLGCSDLGDNWNDTLAQHVDWVMANVHPFFGGLPADEAAGWTYEYWQNNDVAKTNNLPGKKQLISEAGWPSGGGQYCTNENGAQVPCPNAQAGAIASVDNMNLFMDNWVCQALQNGTQYFYFEVFDQPWQAQYNKPGEEWEDKWGLMDPGRNLKPGIKIPDCGGKTASLP